MTFKSVVLLIVFLVGVQSFSFSQRKWKFLLPNEVINELIELDANSTTDPVGVDQAIDTILRNQSAQILDQLDLPPYYERLPFVQRWQIKDILFDRQLSYEQKHQMIRDVIHKIPVDQQKFPHVNSQQHSRYFEAFSTLQYQINFTFKLSELKRALQPNDMQQILHVLGNSQIGMEEKLAEIERVMSLQSYDILDRLFFTGVPIVDAESRERFRRLFVDKGFWAMPQQKLNVGPQNPNCLLKPWCNLKLGTKSQVDESIDQNKVTENQSNIQEKELKKISEPFQDPFKLQWRQINPMNGQMDAVKEDAQEIQKEEKKPKLEASFVIEVQAGNSEPIKQEIPIHSLGQMSTIVVESRQMEVGSKPKVNVFVQQNGKKDKEDEVKPSMTTFQPINKPLKVAPMLQNPASNLPWQLPGFSPPVNRVVKYGAPEPTEYTTTTTQNPNNLWKPMQPNFHVKKQILGPYSSPTRWSQIVKQGPWTHQNERTFLQRWYKHFGIALSDANNPIKNTEIKPNMMDNKQVESKQPEIKQVEPVKVALNAPVNPQLNPVNLQLNPTNNQEKPKINEPKIETPVIVEKPKQLNDDQVKAPLLNEPVEKKSADQEVLNQQKDDPPCKSESVNQKDNLSPTLSPATEANFEALRLAHEKQTVTKEETKNVDEEDKEKEVNVKDPDFEANKKEEKNESKVKEETKKEPIKLMDQTVQASLLLPTIKPPTVVINKEAKEKLVVRHTQKGSTLHLEKLTSAELRDANASNNDSKVEKQIDVKSEKQENDEPSKLLQQPLNDTGTDLLDSITADDNNNKEQKDTDLMEKVKKEESQKIPSGLLKLRDVLKRLRERIRQMPINSNNNSTFSWASVN